ncbi:MAG: hypothetical protein LBI35_05240 [Burkholderiales bacterium]|jgi:hypothetical protein|nr:hypothetical protein [Burkholderiales bacterium]
MGQSLTVDVGARTVSFEEGMRRAADVANQQMKSIGDSINRVNNQISSIGDTFAKFTGILDVLGAGVSFVGMIKGAIDAADQLEKLSQKTGITVEELSGLSYSAKLSGTDLDGVSASISKLSENMVSAASGSGAQAAAFAAVGVSVKDANGKLKDSNVVIGELADKFKSYADGPAKAALAQELFGKSGASMIPLLNQGGEALAKQREEALKYGGVTKEVANKASAFNDEMAKIKLIASGTGSSLAATLLPAMQGVSKWFEWLRDHSREVGTALVAVGTAATIFSVNAVAASSAVAKLTKAFKALNITMLANPFVLVAAAIAGVLAALYYFKDTTFKIGETTASVKDIIVGAWEYIKKAFTAAWEWITGAVEGGKGVFGFFAQTVINAFDFIWQGIKGWANFVICLFVSVGTSIGAAAAGIVDNFRAAFEKLSRLGATFWDGLKKTLSGDLTGFSVFLEEVKKPEAASVSIGQRVKESFSAAFNTDYVGEWASATKTALGGVVESLAIAGKEANKFHKKLNGSSGKEGTPTTGGEGFDAFAKDIEKKIAGILAGYDLIYKTIKENAEREIDILNYQHEMALVSEREFIAKRGALQEEAAQANVERLKDSRTALQAELAAINSHQTKTAVELAKQKEKANGITEKLVKTEQELGKAALDVEDIVRRTRQEQEKYTKSVQDQIDKIKQSSKDYNKSLKERIEDIKFETSLIGKSASAQAKLRVEYELQKKLKSEVNDIEKKVADTQKEQEKIEQKIGSLMVRRADLTKDALKNKTEIEKIDKAVAALQQEEIDNAMIINALLEKKVDLINDTAEATKEIVKAMSEQEWLKKWQDSFDQISQSLTDALCRGFESGKSMAENLKDTLINTFKTMVLKPIIEFAVQGGMNSLSSFFGGMFGGGGGLRSQPNNGVYGPTQDGGNLYTPPQQLPVSGLGMFSSYLGYAAMIYAMMQQNDKLFQQGWQPAGQGNDMTMQLVKHWGISNLLGSAPVLSGVFLNGAIQLGLDKLLRNFGMSGRTASILTGSALWTRALGYKKPEARGGGVQGTLSLDGFDGEMFQDWEQRGGWFRRDRRGTEKEPMSRAMRQLINSTVGKVPQQMADLLKEFGQNFGDVFGDDWSKWFKITLADKGNWDEVGERLSAETARVYREMATVAVESIREGWGVFVEDLKGLSPEEFNTEIQSIILSLSILDDIKGIQDKIFGVTDLVVEDFEALADAGELIYETISRLADTFSITNQLSKITGIKFAGVGLESAAARQSLVDDAGGTEALSELMSSYFNTFATEQERFGIITDSLRETFDGFGIAIPGTVEAFRELVAAQDMSTEAGRTLALQLMQVAPAFDSVIGAIDRLSGAMDAKINDLRRTLEMSGLDQQQTYDYLKKEGDEAFRNLQEATGIDEINKYFEQAIASMNQTFGMMDDEGKRANKEAFLRQLDELEAVKNERIAAAKELITGPVDAIESAGKAVAQALANVAEQLGVSIDIEPFFASAAESVNNALENVSLAMQTKPLALGDVDLDNSAAEAMSIASFALKETVPALENVNKRGAEAQEQAGSVLVGGAQEVRNALGMIDQLVTSLGSALGNIRISVEVVNKEAQVGHAY